MPQKSHALKRMALLGIFYLALTYAPYTGGEPEPATMFAANLLL